MKNFATPSMFSFCFKLKRGPFFCNFFCDYKISHWRLFFVFSLKIKFTVLLSEESFDEGFD